MGLRRLQSLRLLAVAASCVPLLWLSSEQAFAPEPARPNGPSKPTSTSPIAVTNPVPILWAGTFDTNFGLMHFNGGGGTYEFQHGRLWYSSRIGNVVSGYWQQSQSAQKCANGAYYGRYTFAFTLEGFTGTYGYCAGPLTAGAWNGKRR